MERKLELKWKEFNKGLVSHSWGVEIFLNDENITNRELDELIKELGFSDRKDFFEQEKWFKKDFVEFI